MFFQMFCLLPTVMMGPAQISILIISNIERVPIGQVWKLLEELLHGLWRFPGHQNIVS